MKWPRLVLASASVTIFVAVIAVAAALAPDDSRAWLLFCSVLAVAMALQSVTADPKDLAPALLLALPPVVALVAEGSPTWLIGPLGALLLLSGELNALSWECQGVGSMSGLEPRRLLNIGVLALLGMGASLGVAMIGRMWSPGGTAAVAVASVAVAALGGLVFWRRS